MGCNSSTNVQSPSAGASGSASNPMSTPAPAPAAAAAGGAAGATSAEAKVAIALRNKRRGDVFSETFDDSEPYVKKNFPKNDAARACIGTALHGHFLFSTMAEAEMSEFVDAMYQVNLNPGQVVIKQGDNGDAFYVVESGDFDILVNGAKVADSTGGGSFGELALLYNCPRAATVKARSAAKLWAIDRVTFRHLLANSASGDAASLAGTLRRVPLLEGMTDEQISRLVDAVTVMRFNSGETIISKGEEGNVFYMIKEGTVVCSGVESGGATVDDIQLRDGDYFGERALMTNEPRNATVRAVTDVTCLVLDRQAFVELLGPLREVLDTNVGLRVLRTSHILAPLSEPERLRLVEAFQRRTYNDGEVIIREGDPGNEFFILRSGSAVVTREGAADPIATLAQGEIFGEMALLSDEPRMANVTAQGTCDVFVLDRQAFVDLLGPLQDLMNRDAERRKRMLDASAGLELADLEDLALLGTGTFGRVKLVRHRHTGKTYALKILRKAQVVAYKQQTNVMNEKNVMVEADHPFILKLVATFKDTRNLYMLLEVCMGGELFNYLHCGDIDYLASDHARFYAAGVLLAFQYIHAKNIAYRDLKPENLLIDEVGYIKVVDFGFAKVVNSRTYTLCGTPEYLAPEIVLGKGHNKAVDNWALGILIYEMVIGYSPFADDEAGDQMVICRNIVNSKLKYPGWFRDNVCKDLIGKLLVRNAAQRLGSFKRAESDIQDHPWFSGFPWADFLAKRVQAPWIPPLRDPCDTAHFEGYEIEEDEFDDPDAYIDQSGWDASF